MHNCRAFLVTSLLLWYVTNNLSWFWFLHVLLKQLRYFILYKPFTLNDMFLHLSQRNLRPIFGMLLRPVNGSVYVWGTSRLTSWNPGACRDKLHVKWIPPKNVYLTKSPIEDEIRKLSYQKTKQKTKTKTNNESKTALCFLLWIDISTPAMNVRYFLITFLKEKNSN